MKITTIEAAADMVNTIASAKKSGLECSPVSAVDLFCGAGGLTYGLMQAGIKVEAGIDNDMQAKFAYTANNPGAQFHHWDISSKNCRSIKKLFRAGKLRLLAGCAPCKPFSKLTSGIKNHDDWDLLDYFGRFVRGIVPDLVTMENVPELADRGAEVFRRFVGTLESLDYCIDWRIVSSAEYGVPQVRRRLVLLASRIGKIAIPNALYPRSTQWKTVRQAIGDLRSLKIGEADPNDTMHVAPLLSPLNLKRLQATPHNGGNRREWPDELVLECHRKKSGERYGSIYGRMWWDKPAPTMTTLCTGIGNGRFGHPEQDRSITLREAALFQSFPRRYAFWPTEEKLNKSAVSKLIGNAVPPKLAKALGKAIIRHIQES
jgi:DNA (cytosine-5)-methyltransferase 1